jgi:high-affinity iron transporter
MLATALIVFRETLEAALFVGIVAAATRGVAGRGRWLGGGVAAGVLGALVLALLAERIAAWADGVGQDLVNVAILSAAFLMLAWHGVWGAQHGREAAADARRMGHTVRDGGRAPLVLALACALAVLREGAETVLFVLGMTSGDGASPWPGIALGLVGGVALGALLYFGLSRIPVARVMTVTQALILLVTASVASQLARALMQAGLVQSLAEPLWDSSAWLAPDSALGALLHALAGYEARPTGLQLLFYVGALVGITLLARLARTPPWRRPAPA